MRTVELRGKYGWELYLDIDNSNNDGVISRTETYKSTLHINHKDLIQKVQDDITKADASLNVGAIVKLVNIGVTGSVSNEAVRKLEESSEKNSDHYEETTQTTEINIAARSRLILYQLVFNGPGITQKLGTLSSTRHEIDDVIINCSVSLVKFIKNFEVVYTDDAISKPDDSIQEVDGLNADINSGFGGKFIWLVPEWTTNPDEAATGIEVLIQESENNDYDDLAKGAGGSFRYLKMLRQSNTSTKISRIALWRTENSDSKPSKQGWTNWTGDINSNRRGDYLYVCWENVSI